MIVGSLKKKIAKFKIRLIVAPDSKLLQYLPVCVCVSGVVLTFPHETITRSITHQAIATWIMLNYIRE